MTQAFASRRLRVALPILRAAALIAAIVSIWLPHLEHFHVARSDLTAALRSMPDRQSSDSTLAEVADMALGVPLVAPDDDPLPIARQILDGRLDLPRTLPGSFPLRNYPNDYLSGPPTFQLMMASLEVERTLLRAYERSGDARFLDAARSRFMAFADHESRRLVDEAFLWNDHALGARVAVLALLWKTRHASPTASDAFVDALLSFAQRSGNRLAKPNQFTVRTNHGVIQNIALLQIAAAFPMLNEAATWRQVAVDRLRVQLPFYVSPEGFVLEHSASYHAFGTELLSMAVRLLVLNGVTPDPSLLAAAHRARDVLRLLWRPDGTLPPFGNTSSGHVYDARFAADDGKLPLETLRAPHPPPADGNHVFPVAGYDISWMSDGTNPSQLVVAWAKHDGHGHKHADEGSVLLWSDGTDWLTSTGYWPYGIRHEDDALSWSGSNAPHELGESADVRRTVALLSTGSDVRTRFLDVRRHNATSALDLRRQVIQIDGGPLLIVDFGAGLSKSVETVWTVDPALRLRPIAPGLFRSSAARGGGHEDITYSGDTCGSSSVVRASDVPFGGWQVVDGVPTPADALRLVGAQSPTHACAVAVDVSRVDADVGPDLKLFSGARPDTWTLTYRRHDTLTTVRRQATSLRVTKTGLAGTVASDTSIALAPPPDPTRALEASSQAFARAVATYPPWRDLQSYRQRLSILFVMLAVGIEVCIFGMSRMRGRGRAALLHVGVVVFWTITVGWALGIYLR